MLKRFGIALLVLILGMAPYVKGQYLFFNSDEPPKIDISFAKHSVEAKKGKTIFNVVKIVNQSSTTQSFTFQLTVPSGWQVIGDDKQEITLAPLDSIFVPVRVAIGEKVRGDIGYSVIAAISDNRGNTIKNEYSFIKIPREYDLRVKILTRFEYFEQQSGHTKFRVLVENRGNREETVTMLIQGNSSLGIEDARNSEFVKDVNISPYSDSIIDFNIYLDRENLLSKENYKLNFTAKTIDSTYKGTCWVRNLGDQYSNDIPESRKMLITEFFARGLFSNFAKPAYSSIIQGNILFPKSRELYFFYNNDDTKPTENLYKYNRMWLGYKTNKLNIEVGDLNKSIESSLHGRGGGISSEFKKIKIEAYATQRIRNPQNNFGSEVTFSPTENVGILMGGVYTSALNNIFESKLGVAGVNVKIAKNLKLGIQGVFNQIRFENLDNTVFNKNVYGTTATLSFNKKRLSVSARYKSGQKFLNSSHNGRSELYTQSIYLFNNGNYLSYYISDNRNSPGDYNNYYITYQPFTNFHKELVNYNYQATPKFNIYTGPGVEYNSSDIFPVIQRGKDFFSTFVYNYNFGARLKGDKQGSSLTANIFSGFVRVWHKPLYFIDSTFSVSNIKNKFNYQYFTINLRQPKWGVQAMYTNGPRSIYEQFSWYYSSRETRLLRIMPYFDSYIYKDLVKLMVNVSYTNDLVSKSSYSNITSQLFWYLPRDWQIRLLNVYTVQSRVTTTENVERYQNMYFEASLRKEFGFQQPVIKYYNLKLVFFKDYNGNRIKNDNEPGIKNVLVSIQRTDTENMELTDFTSGELLSNQYGEVEFENIPSGTYKIEYNPVGKDAGTFSKADIGNEIRVDKKNTTYYIPFVEKNKIFGKIILNRSRLSGLGKIDVSNVRISATDSRGNTYSTLTDKNGEFLIFAPITDEYVVNVNNIFYENFDLRQNNFRVQFNGYKQFEVNFVFDEKIRRINFSPSTQQDVTQGVLQIRRTNLRGTVKDATSLKPLRARVNLINIKNNSVEQSIYSSPTSGDYNLSFMANDNYLIEVIADDYWYYSENLNLNQVTTFMNVTKDILLKPIAIGSQIELNIHFDINKADLGPETVAELNRLLRILKDNSNIRIEIQGHCDDLEAVSNSQIGEERAKAVAKYLIENGFSNLQVRGFGNTNPIAPNDSEENRAKNRRVEIEVIGK